MEDGEFRHLSDMIENLSADLSEPKRNDVVQLLKVYPDIFSEHEYDVGYTTLLEAHRLAGHFVVILRFIWTLLTNM